MIRIPHAIHRLSNIVNIVIQLEGLSGSAVEKNAGAC